jgi:hypothetical protein
MERKTLLFIFRINKVIKIGDKLLPESLGLFVHLIEFLVGHIFRFYSYMFV